MATLRFEWDENKSRINARKHGVSFDEAKTVFYDDYARLIDDPEHSEGEERFILLGFSASLRLLVVCHCILMKIASSGLFQPEKQPAMRLCITEKGAFYESRI